MRIPFENDCAVYAVAFICRIDPDDARYRLWMAGRPGNDGTYDWQITKAIRGTGRHLRRCDTVAKTIRTFARECRPGAFLITTCDHAVAVVDGNICQRPIPRNSDLMRIEQCHKILLDPT